MDNFSSSKTQTVPVKIQDINKTLLLSLQKNLSNLNDSFIDLNESSKRQYDETKVSSIASERKNRAVYNALYGEIKKNFNLMDSLKTALMDSLKKIVDILSSGFKESLRSFASLSASMRQERLSAGQKAYLGEASSQAVGGVKDLFGMNVSKSTASTALLDLYKNGIDLQLLTAEQRDAYIALSKDLDFNEAYRLATTASINSLKQIVNDLSDPLRRGSTKQLIEKGDAVKMSNAGGVDQYLNDISKATFGLAKFAGSYLDASNQASIADTFLSFKSGQIEDLKDKEIVNILYTMGLNQNSTFEELGEIINKRALEASKSEEGINELARQLRVLSGGQDSSMDRDFANRLMMGAQQQRNGLGPQNVRSYEENESALELSTEKGLFNQKIDSFLSGIDAFTGGALTDLSNGLDEWFGDSLTIEEVVTSGFKLVSTILAGIAASKVITSPSSLLSGLVGTLTGAVGVNAGSGFLKGNAPNVGAIAGDAGAKSGGKGSIGKLGKNAKFVKGAGAVGAVLAVGTLGAELYSIYNDKQDSLASSKSSAEFVKKERELQKSTKDAKAAISTVSTAVGAAGALAGATAGAKLGAVIGTFGGPIGTAIGLSIGAASGAAVGAISSAISEGVEALNNVKIRIENINDIRSNISELENILKETSLSQEQRFKYEKELSEAKRDLAEAQKENVQNLLNDYRSNIDSDFTENKISDLLARFRENLDKDTAKENELTKQLESLKSQPNSLANDRELRKVESELKQLRDHSLRTREAIALATTENMGLKVGESVEDAIKRLSDDVRGEGGFFDTTEDKELEAAKTLEGLDKLIIEKTIDSLTDGVFHETLDSLKEQDESTIEEFSRQLAKERGISLKAQSDFIEQVKKLVQQSNIATVPYETLAEFAVGGVVDNPTKALVGEAGKEAILPLTNLSALSRVLNSLSLEEKSRILGTLLDENADTFSKYVPSSSILEDLTSLSKEAVASAVKELKNSSSENSVKNSEINYSELINLLSSMTKYLKEIASSPSNKRFISPAVKPSPVKF